MANYLVTHTIMVADVDGQLARVQFRVRQADTVTLATLATTSGTFNTDLAAATNGKVIERGFSVLVDEAQIIPGSTPPTDAEYPSVTDGARINFSNAGGGRGHLTVPAPTATTFRAAPNREQVDPAGDAAALIAFLKTNYSDPGGSFLNLYQGGIKVGRRARKRRPPKAGLS